MERQVYAKDDEQQDYHEDLQHPYCYENYYVGNENNIWNYLDI